MAQSQRDLRTEQEAAQNMTVGPGVVATKSQALGGFFNSQSKRERSATDD